MASESRLIWLIFAALVALIVIPLGLWQLGESRRPVLEEVRIATASADDPVFRTGARAVSSADELQIVAALRVRGPDGALVWMAPVEQLAIDGTLVEHLESGAWPEDDRVLRVFWFTVESGYLGGDLTTENAAKMLGQRSYLAPEMGRGLLAKTAPEQHNDDQINLGDDNLEVGGGTIRLYAKVEVAEKADSLASEQSAASAGAGAAFDESFTTVRIAETFSDPISPAVGELFRLPGFEPQEVEGSTWNETTRASYGASFTDLVERRFVVSSWTFASVALTGGLGLSGGDLSDLGQVDASGEEPLRAGRRLSWGDDVLPGDLLVDRGQYIVLVADDGDSVLGRSDRVMLCWRRPAAITTLDQATRRDAVSFALLRHGN